MPMTDANGIAQTGSGVFSFTVSTQASNAITIPYEVNITQVTLDCTGTDTPTGCYDSMTNAQIKAYLTKGGTAVSETTASGALISTLTDSTLRSGAKILHSDNADVFTGTGQSAKTSNYALRLWISSAINYDAVSGKEYHAKVNVDSHVSPLS